MRRFIRFFGLLPPFFSVHVSAEGGDNGVRDQLVSLRLDSKAEGDEAEGSPGVFFGLLLVFGFLRSVVPSGRVHVEEGLLRGFGEDRILHPRPEGVESSFIHGNMVIEFQQQGHVRHRDGGFHEANGHEVADLFLGVTLLHGEVDHFGLHVVVDHEGGQHLLLVEGQAIQGRIDVFEDLLHVQFDVWELFVFRESEVRNALKILFEFFDFLVHGLPLFDFFLEGFRNRGRVDLPFAEFHDLAD